MTKQPASGSSLWLGNFRPKTFYQNIYGLLVQNFLNSTWLRLIWTATSLCLFNSGRDSRSIAAKQQRFHTSFVEESGVDDEATDTEGVCIFSIVLLGDECLTY